MDIRTLSLPTIPRAVDLIPTIDPPPALPTPVALPVASLPAPAIVVPLVEVPLSPPSVPNQVTTTTTTTVSDAPPLQPPATTTMPASAQGSAGAAAATVRAASMLDGCAKPAYPAQAARNGDSGTVTLALLVGVDGRVTGSRIARSSGVGELDRESI